MSKPIDEGISRREALQGGSAAAVAVGAGLLSTQLVRRAQAATSGDPRILLGDAATDPNENGEFARNGADVKAYSGGAVRNLSNIGPSSNVPDWQEDGNSPINSSGSQSATITLNGTYDNVRVIIQEFTNSSGSQQDLGVRINGYTSSQYNYTTIDGSRTSSAADWQIDASVVDATTLTGYFDIAETDNGIAIQGPCGDGSSRTLLSGLNNFVTKPLDSITLRGGSGNVTVKARVYGWSGGI